MKLTRASSYAIHAMAHIAKHKSNYPLPSHEVAQAHGIPERFLLKVLKPLVSAGMLYSIKGPRGGYRLAKAPNQITMLEMIEAVEGPIRGMSSFHADPSNNQLEKRLGQICAGAADATRKQLAVVKLSTLAAI